MSANDRERSSEEIRRDIERTRAEMDETVDALENRLSPGQLLDQVWGSMKKGGAGGMGDVVRDHPVPLALMGLGVAWLAVEKSNGSSARDVDQGTYARAEGRRGPYMGDAVDHDDPDWDHTGTGSKLKAKAKGAASSVADAARDAKEGVMDAASSVMDAASSAKDRAGESHMLEDARDAVKGKARQAHGTLDRVLHDQPLALGAVSFGLGLAAGLAAPTTRWEDRTMGHTSDTLKEEVMETARETGEKVAHVAQDAAHAAREEADRQGMGDSITEKVKQVASAASDAAHESAEREHLDADSLMEEGREAVRKTRDTAKRDMT